MSADTLQIFAPFFCSAFVRIPEPARGPLAFCEFWAHIQPSLAHLNGAYPEEIKAALRASHDVLGIDVVADISLETYIDGRPSALVRIVLHTFYIRVQGSVDPWTRNRRPLPSLPPLRDLYNDPHGVNAARIAWTNHGRQRCLISERRGHRPP